MAGQPPLIGVTGAIGAGKSSVLQAFALRGCACLSADAIVHTLYHQARVRDAVVARFGAAVLGADGEVDRIALGRLVFADPAALRWLEELIHPLVAEHMTQWLAEAQLRDPAPPLVVYESPLLFEARLADPATYADASVNVADLQREKVRLEREIAHTEHEWLVAQEAYEAA